ncbi:MAG: malate dehydrogenase [Gammaproteobacteria bacterium]|nr:malate dehydrogenase [Gammaproteobacteria bacterium]MCW8910349.1 malate dehydrogenase [Gammaproteobacteria bacterium]MCW9005315.1 malate dehydrogenase [Gammaproteobacteria bacterium]MCW9057010.1 malate dehydrogenase [Gammaproteobacteria bacterium]
MKAKFKQAALDYHKNPKPGKIATEITKPCNTQRDLSLAYTPGVAEPVRAIAINKDDAYKYTAKGNLIAVITDGSAVLGLGNVGALAGKPVMEGKAVLFKRFADIDVFDIEVDTQDTEEFIKTVAHIAPTFGGINLEDISAPRCFEIERRLDEMLDIPVFHDDQHGTAIIIAAGLMNAMELQGKKIETARIVCMGAGAAGIASMKLLAGLGAKKENMILLDRNGVIHKQRDDLNEFKIEFANDTDKRTPMDAMTDADIFIGVSGPDLLTPDMLKAMAPNPIVFALSNPSPEIQPDLAHQTRDDILMATGRSDYPNQVNNVLGFPYIFRGAMDAHAHSITQEMHIAAVHAICALTHEPVPQEVLDAYELEHLEFGHDYIIPKPIDPRLIERIPQAVSRAAIDSGVARINID